MATKNIGQVAGVYIGNTPPENIILIWYDNTPSQMRHKIYDPGLSHWVVLDQNVISLITYSELINIAKNVGLSIGQYFQIKDKGNALALAITTTKVQYDDELGNILIDDLGTNIQYHVTSSNLLVDDIVGVFDVVNKKLVFQFKEMVPDYTADDYILGKVKRNNVWSLAKFKLSSFLSKVTGNSITWNGGFFFNFSNAISNILDKKGGVVSKDTYDIDKQNIATDIQNVGKENQTIIENANTAISNATSATVIYDKQTPAVETGGEPTDVATGDKLITIVSKFQRYINKFKFATGIKISKNFSTLQVSGNVNNNDNVETAIAKLQKKVEEINTDTIEVSENFIIPETSSEVVIGDDLTNALGKLQKQVKTINTDSLVDNSVNLFKLSSLITQCYLEFYLVWDGSQWTRAEISKIFIPEGISVSLGKPIVSDGITFRWHYYVSDTQNKERTRVVNSEILSFDAFNMGYLTSSDPYVVTVYNRGTQGSDGMGFKMSQNINGVSSISLTGSLFFLIRKP